MTLATYVRAVARDMTMSTPWLREDTEQECFIAAWEAGASERAVDVSPYVKAAIRHAAYDTVVRGRSTGSERAPGGNSGRFKWQQMAPLVDEDWQEREDVAQEAAERVTVWAAVEELPRRDRAISHGVALGLTWAQIGAAVGLTGGGASVRWGRDIRPRLREALA